jgi:hypothetical protein
MPFEFKSKAMNNLVTKIWWRGRYHNVKPDQPPKDTRQLDSFLVYNDAAKCFVKIEGGWYKLTRDGRLLFVSRVLYLLSLAEWLLIAKDDNFIANTRRY